MTGFTLIELMIVIVIIAILAAIAYPSYTHYITDTNRSAAEACLSEYANYMERYYATNLSYKQNKDGDENALPALDCETQTKDNYTYEIAKSSDTTYLLQAAPRNAQASRDTACGTLTLDQTGQRGITGNGKVSDCW